MANDNYVYASCLLTNGLDGILTKSRLGDDANHNYNDVNGKEDDNCGVEDDDDGYDYCQLFCCKPSLT